MYKVPYYPGGGGYQVCWEEYPIVDGGKKITWKEGKEKAISSNLKSLGCGEKYQVGKGDGNFGEEKKDLEKEIWVEKNIKL